MSNQIGLRCHLTQPPQSVLCDSRAHVFNYECGGIAYHSQASVTPVVAKGTYLTASEVEKHINKDYLCGAPTKGNAWSMVEQLTYVAYLSFISNIPRKHTKWHRYAN